MIPLPTEAHTKLKEALENYDKKYFEKYETEPPVASRSLPIKTLKVEDFDHIGSDFRALLEFMVHSGCRPTESLNIICQY